MRYNLNCQRVRRLNPPSIAAALDRTLQDSEKSNDIYEEKTMNRKLISVFVLLALMAGIVGAQDSYELTIMHTNDVHGHHEPQRNGDGGAARQATVVNQIRAEG